MLSSPSGHLRKKYDFWRITFFFNVRRGKININFYEVTDGGAEGKLEMKLSILDR